jgi:thiamine biosynthesis protein ThiS
MMIQVNGETRDIPAGLTVTGLLARLGISAERVAIERNLEILPRPRWEDTTVAPDDRFEIVHFVGGG